MKQIVSTSALVLLICFALPAALRGQSRGRPQTFDSPITLPNPNAVRETPPSSLQGTVVSESTGEPLAGATVTISRYFENGISLLLSGEDPTSSIPPARTDDKGGFSFAGLRGNAYDLTVQLEGYLPLRLGPRDRNGLGGYVTFVPGQHVNDLKFALTKAASLGGRVQTETGQVSAGIPLRLFREDSTASVAQTSTAADGTWLITGFAPGRYVLVAGYPFVLNGELARSFSTRISVPNTDPPVLDFPLDNKGGLAIRGRLSSDSNPVPPKNPGLTIRVMSPGEPVSQAPGIPFNYDSRSGTFEIPGLFPGVYLINAQWDDPDGGCARAVVPVSNADVAGLDLPLKPCGN